MSDSFWVPLVYSAMAVHLVLQVVLEQGIRDAIRIGRLKQVMTFTC